MTQQQKRLEYLRGELNAERISYGELAELQSLKKHIQPDDVQLLEAAGVPEHLEDEISIVWSIEDVKSLDDSLTDDECREILQAAVNNHDATIGINWDVLQYHIDELKESKKN